MKHLLIILFLIVKTFANNEPSAVQIIETAEGGNGTRILQYKNAVIMKEILMAEDIKDLPILVYSVTGKTRGGKSFLLDLMYKYLSSDTQPKGDKDRKEGQIPNLFDFKDGAESTTKGLWISSTVFKRILKDGTEVGVMLMDNQGLFDGEVTSGESVAMSGVSTILSHVQMFNLIAKITTNDLEQIILHLVPEKVKEDTHSNTTVGSSLMFVVRDFMGGRRHGFGLKNGTKYIEAEQNKGTQEYRSMWAEHRSVFNKIECVLLPHPGIHVMSEDFTQNPNLQDLDANFVTEIDSFLQQLFASENLVPPPMPLTGKKIHEILLGLDGKVADLSLSYFNMFIDRSNEATVQEAVNNFTARLNTSDIFKARDIMTLVLSQNKFRGQSATKYSADLQEKIEDIINDRVITHLIYEYENATNGDDVKHKHKVIWPEMTSNMSLFLGSQEKISSVKQKTVKAIAKIFYSNLATEEIKKLEKFCEEASSQVFYDTMLELNATESYEQFVASKIGYCNDFENIGLSETTLNDIRLTEQSKFGAKVKITIIRKMFKVKEYIIARYTSLLGETEVQIKNSLIWPAIEKDINNLVYETESERDSITEDIIKNIATEYYKRFSKEVNMTLSSDWATLNDGDFMDMYENFKGFDKRQIMVKNKFPEYPPFRDEGLTSIYEDEEYLLERLIELAIYQNLKERGFSEEANSFWEMIKVYFAKVTQKIINWYDSSIDETCKKARSKIELGAKLFFPKLV